MECHLYLIFGKKIAEPSNPNSYTKEMALAEKNNIIALSLNFTQGLNIFTIAHKGWVNLLRMGYYLGVSFLAKFYPLFKGLML